jgi:protein tyrosine phosphatase
MYKVLIRVTFKIILNFVNVGPTIKCMGDMSAFWIMVWQEKVGKIVMLTKLIEAGVSMSM